MMENRCVFKKFLNGSSIRVFALTLLVASFLLTFFVSQDAFALTKPTLLSPASNAEITTTSCTFTWSHPYNDQYELKIKTSGGTLKYASGNISSKSKTVDLSSIGLTYGSTYKWYVVVRALGQEDSSEDRWFTYRPSGYCSVSGLSVSANPAVLGQSFNISVSLKETRGFPKTFESVAIAIQGPNDAYLFDFAMYNNVSIGASGTWSQTATNTIYTTNPAGTYKALIRGKVGGQWFDFDTTGTGVNPRTFTVISPQVTTGGVTGRLHIGSATGSNLSSASVTCGGKSTTTASDGTYTITGIAAGSQTLSFSKAGYQPFSRTVIITAGQTLNAGDNYLVASSSDDHGNSCDSATLVNVNSTTNGNIGTAGDYDYFRVQVPSSGTLTVYTTGSTDTYGYLKNSGCVTIVSNDDSGDRNFRLSSTVTAGTYYVAVRHYSSTGIGNYVLYVQFSSASNNNNYILYPLSADLSIAENQVTLNNLFGAQAYGGTHTGVDIMKQIGAPVYSVGNGTVKINNTNRNYGTLYANYWNSFLVVYYPSLNRYVYYGHLVSNLPVGSNITRGQNLGTLRGAYNSSNVRTPSADHLHLGVKTNLITSNWGYTAAGTSVSTLEQQGWRDPVAFMRGQ